MPSKKELEKEIKLLKRRYNALKRYYIEVVPLFTKDGSNFYQDCIFNGKESFGVSYGFVVEEGIFSARTAKIGFDVKIRKITAKEYAKMNKITKESL